MVWHGRAARTVVDAARTFVNALPLLAVCVCASLVARSRASPPLRQGRIAWMRVRPPHQHPFSHMVVTLRGGGRPTASGTAHDRGRSVEAGFQGGGGTRITGERLKEPKDSKSATGIVNCRIVLSRHFEDCLQPPYHGA